MNSETKTAGFDVELKASDWKLEGQNIVGVISVLRGPSPEIKSESKFRGRIKGKTQW
jgi:hypothetical protein